MKNFLMRIFFWGNGIQAQDYLVNKRDKRITYGFGKKFLFFLVNFKWLKKILEVARG